MSSSKPDQKKVTRYAIWGAVILGGVGFFTGLFICLYHRLPIPPLFITELGLIAGGCLGALCALTNTEKRVIPTLLSLAGAALVSLGLGLTWWQGTVGLLTAGAFTWTLADSNTDEDGLWKIL